jgi:hypothetical protein
LPRNFDEKKKEKYRKLIYSKLLNHEEIKITELAKFLDKTSTAIRKWEQQGIVKKPRIVNGIRMYNIEELCEFMRMLLSHNWQRQTFNHEEMKGILNYLESAVDVMPKKRKIKDNPYEFDGDIY